MLAAKAFDPVVGIDIHLIQPPGPVPPIPVPHPFVGILFDPTDFLPILGATVYINSLPRATAGTAGKAVPSHIPIGGTFIKPPANDCEVFMGSSTVVVDGEPLSHLGLPVLSCQDIGMPPPVRPKKRRAPKSFYLPSSVVLPIPAGRPVLIGGPPTVSLSALGMRAAMAGLGKAFKKLRRVQKASRRWKATSEAIRKRAKAAMNALGVPPNAQNRVSRAICTATGHPVDVATGKVFTDSVDLELPGPIPFKFERVWYSCSTYQGPLGHGWHHSYDLALIERDGAVAVRLADGRAAAFPVLEVGGSSFERMERMRLTRTAEGHRLRDEASGLTYVFEPLVNGASEQRLIQVEDRNGNAIRFHYDGAQHLSWIQDSGGRVLSLESDGEGRLLAIHGPAPDGAAPVLILRYAYSESGDLVEVADASGTPFRYRYDAEHLLVQETDRQGLSFYFKYECSPVELEETPMPRCVRTWGDGGIYARAIRYDPVLQQTEVTDSRGAKTVYFSNALGLVIRAIDAGGGTTVTEWSEHAQKLSEMLPNGAKIEYAYDDQGRLVQRTDPGGAQTCIEYNDAGDPTVLTDPLGQRWEQERDERGNVLALVDPLGGRTEYRPDSRGFPLAVTSPAGERVQFEWDEGGNLVRHTDASGAETRLTYDRLGRLVQRTDAEGGLTRLAWDLSGRVIAIVDAEGRVSRFGYDVAGNLVEAINARGDLRRYGYGPMGVLTQVIEPSGAITRYRYDTEGNLVRLTDAVGRPWRFERDSLGRITEETDPTGRELRYGYDRAGQLAEMQSAAGEVTRLERDEAGRLVKKIYADGTEESFSYDQLGRLVEAESTDVVVEFAYDPLGRITEERLNGENIQSRYDAAGWRTERISPWGRSLRFEVDTAQRIQRIRAGEALLLERQFDPLGRETRRALPSGIAMHRCYSRTGELLESRTLRGGSAVLERSYEYNALGQLARVEDNLQGALGFEHDIDGRLKAALYPEGRLVRYLFDEAGNVPAAPLERAGLSGSGAGAPYPNDESSGRKAERVLERMVVAEGAYLTYDADRQLIRKEKGGRTWHYHYDSAARLREVTTPEGERVTFGYDALGRRASKTWTSSNGQHRRSTLFYWDGDHLLGERDSRSGAVREYLFEEESFTPLAILEGGEGEDLLLETDQVGTPRAAYSRRTGELAWHTSLGVWGEEGACHKRHHQNDVEDLPDLSRTEPPENKGVPFRFQGQYADVETGLCYNRFRYYDPELRAYTQPDPIGLAGGEQLHGYVHDPTGWVDPYGLSKACGATQKPRVLGETMATRVEPVAAALGAHTFQPRSNSSLESIWKRNQRQWIRRQIQYNREKGTRIFDIGIDPNRRTRSPYYTIETETLLKNGYERIYVGDISAVVDGETKLFRLFEWIRPGP